MEAKELRLGNFVKIGESEYWNKDAIGKVFSVDMDILKDVIERFEKYPYSPIPLTEDWLIRLGFVQNTEVPIYTFGAIIVGLFANETTVDIDDDDDNIVSLDIQLRHVHQLQNLVFALTGTELVTTK